MRPSTLDLLHKGHGNMQRVLTLVRAQVNMLQGTGDLSGFVLLNNALDYMHNYPGLSHHPAEEILFSKLKVVCPDARASCDKLLAQHRWFGVKEIEMLRMARRAQAGDTVAYTEFRQQMNAYCEAHVDHIGREESEILPLARERLPESDWWEALVKLQAVADPLFSADVRNRYESLYDYLMDVEISSHN